MVVEELIPEMSQGQHSNVGTVFFAVGFSVMMVLAVFIIAWKETGRQICRSL